MAKRWRGRASAVAGVVAIAGVLVLFPSAAAASGGGGCGGPVSDAAGTRVDIRGNCFSPTILRAAPGDVITFTNTDPNTHTVLGANGAWGGYDLLKRGREATYAFTEAGVYPYVCTLHAGWSGRRGRGRRGGATTRRPRRTGGASGTASTLGTVRPRADPVEPTRARGRC
jgi:plastocyanin